MPELAKELVKQHSFLDGNSEEGEEVINPLPNNPATSLIEKYIMPIKS